MGIRAINRGSMTGLYVGWGRPNSWGEALAADLGAKAFFTQEAVADARRAWDKAPLRYVSDLHRSLRAVAECNPAFLMWQVPPSVGPILIRGGWRRVPWGLDVHSGAVNLSRWKWLLPFLKWAAQHAAVTVVHNTEIATLIRPWPSPVVVVDNYVVPLADVPAPRARQGQGVIAVVASGAIDEPLHVVASAATLLGDGYQVIITGRRHALLRRLGRSRLPPNVRLSGFLSRREYLELLASARMTICLTDRPATMQLGAWEAVSLGCPVVVSGHSVLRDHFRDVAEFTDNSPEALATAIRRVSMEHSRYAKAAESMANMMRKARTRQLREVRERLEQGSAR